VSPCNPPSGKNCGIIVVRLIFRITYKGGHPSVFFQVQKQIKTTWLVLSYSGTMKSATLINLPCFIQDFFYLKRLKKSYR
jgi:hypothetical protein